jgi:outer membrane protein, multidrug efflux system
MPEKCTISRVLGILLLLLLTSCTVGPDYRRPTTEVPDEWGNIPCPSVTTDPLEGLEWWRLFQDETLDSLMERAILSNKDLKLAEARIREARAQWRMAGAQGLPSLDASTSAMRTRRSANATEPSARGTLSHQNLFQAGFDAGWEIDIFGGIRRAVEAAEAEIGASEEDLRDVRLSLMGEVAINYLTLRGAQARLAIARKNIQTRKETLDLTRGRFSVGLSNRLEVAQAETLLALAESDLPGLESDVRQSIHRLGVLLGFPPETLIQELSIEQAIPSGPPEVPIGLPSDLLRRRPDVRRAERRLAAATARVGEATADLFPRFSLTGLIGLSSAQLPDLVSADSRYYSVGPTISWPVFDAGRIRANIEVRDARREQALIDYESAVLTSLEDTENALVAIAKEQGTFQALARAVESSSQAADMAHELYLKGLTDFLNVLVSQGALYQAEDQFVQSKQRLSTSVVALFKALGGGWETTSGKENP